MNIVVLVSGCQGSGKTTTSDKLAEVLWHGYGVNVIRTRYAAVLYEMHNAVVEIGRKYGIPLKDKESRLLQVMGTEWGRYTVDKNIWVNATVGKVASEFQNSKSNINVAILDDCRFVNEFHAFDSVDGVKVVKVRLDANEDVRRARAVGWREDTKHESETGLDEYAKEGKFDLFMPTDLMTQDMVVSVLELHVVKMIQGG